MDNFTLLLEGVRLSFLYGNFLLIEGCCHVLENFVDLKFHM
jgi:hypothetical protein